ncbi:MAG: hypothetical protein WCP57_08915 [Bacteroidota bacterium]
MEFIENDYTLFDEYCLAAINISTGNRAVTMAANSLSFNATNGNFIYNPSGTGKMGIGGTPTTYKLEVLGSDASINTVRVGLGASSIASNTAIGNGALNANTTGSLNTAVGNNALVANTIGAQNTAIGYNALLSNTSGGNNIALGQIALQSNISGNANVALGNNSMPANVSGGSNIAVGYNNLTNNIIGSNNCALGFNALYYNTSSNNTAIGYGSGLNNTSGSSNTFLGRGADAGVGSITNATAIGASAIVSQSNSVILGNAANVGIGTSTPTYKLDVTGVINASTGYRVGSAVAATGSYLRGNGSEFVASTIQAGDIPAGSGNYIQNQIAADQTAGFRINGKANVNNGSPFAVPNNYMAAGSLTIGGITANYGGGSAWNASTSGLLMEALDNTEIAVHDAGTRVASLMYFEGAGTNRINIGRDMGWGTISTISMNGNVGIGTTGPANKLSVNGTIEAIDFGASGSQNIKIGDDAFLSDMDIAHTSALISTTDATIGAMKLGNGSNQIRTSNGTQTGSFGQALNMDFDDLDNTTKGITIEGGDIESGGFFANGNTAAIWSPGDGTGGLFSIYDEDLMNAGSTSANTTAALRLTGGGVLNLANLAGAGNRPLYADATGNIVSSVQLPKSTQVWNQNSNIPAANPTAFTTTAGSKITIIASGSGYKGSAGLIGMDIYVDGVFRGSCRSYTNEISSHKAFTTNALVVSGLAAGNHSMQLVLRTGTDATTADANDFFSATVIETPY